MKEAHDPPNQLPEIGGIKLDEMEDGIIYFGDDLCETTSFYVVDDED